jgi:hypothetical protein
MIPGNDFQAIALCSDGGKDGTGGYSVLDLGVDGKVKELFDSDKYSLMGWFKVVDLNKDGNAEIIDYSSPFGALEDSDHMFVSKVQVEKIFYFDSKKDAFIPANKKLFDQFESEISLRKGKAKTGDLKDVLTLSSIFWFGGKPKEGWEMFDKDYKQDDKPKLVEEIKSILSKDPYMQAQEN